MKLRELFLSTDFSKYYKSSLDGFWASKTSIYKDSIKAGLVVSAIKQFDEGSLSSEALLMVFKAVGANANYLDLCDAWGFWNGLTSSDLSGDDIDSNVKCGLVDVAAYAAPNNASESEVTKTLKLFSYRSMDLICISDDDKSSPVLLYVPGNSSPIHMFCSVDDMRKWLASTFVDPKVREEIKQHFLKDKSETLHFDLDITLRGLGAGSNGLVLPMTYFDDTAHDLIPPRKWNPLKDIEVTDCGDVFDEMAARVKKRSYTLASTVVSQADLKREEALLVIEHLGMATMVLLPIGIAIPPLGVVLDISFVLLGVGEVVIGVQEVEAGREAGAGHIFFGLLNALPVLLAGVKVGTRAFSTAKKVFNGESKTIQIFDRLGDHPNISKISIGGSILKGDEKAYYAFKYQEKYGVVTLYESGTSGELTAVGKFAAWDGSVATVIGSEAVTVDALAVADVKVDSLEELDGGIYQKPGGDQYIMMSGKPRVLYRESGDYFVKPASGAGRQYVIRDSAGEWQCFKLGLRGGGNGLLEAGELQNKLSEVYWKNKPGEIAGAVKFWKEFPKTANKAKRTIENIVKDVGPGILERLEGGAKNPIEKLHLFRGMGAAEAEAILEWKSRTVRGEETLVKDAVESYIKGAGSGSSSAEITEYLKGVGNPKILPVFGHLGSEAQATKYVSGGGGDRLLKFTLKPEADKLLFSNDCLALAPAGKGATLHFARKGGFSLGNLSEGSLAGYIGMKSEKGEFFSLAVGGSTVNGDPGPSQLLLQLLLEDVEDVTDSIKKGG